MNAKEIRREQIIDAAAGLFAQRDFGSVQMDEVAAVSEVSKGTLYNHFDSKEDLYLSILRHRFSRLSDLLEEAYAKRRDGWQNLRSFIIHWQVFMLKHPHFFLILRKSDALFLGKQDEQCRKIRDRIRNLLAEVIRGGIRDGSFRRMNVAVAADLVMGMVEQRVLSLVEQNITRHDPESVLDVLRRGISADSAGGEK